MLRCSIDQHLISSTFSSNSSALVRFWILEKRVCFTDGKSKHTQRNVVTDIRRTFDTWACKLLLLRLWLRKQWVRISAIACIQEVAPNLNVNVRNGSRAADRKCQAEMENVYESESSFGHSKIMKSVWLLARMHRNLNAIRRCNSIKWHLFRIYLQNWQLSFNNIAQWNGLASTFILHIRISFGLVFFF